MGGFVRRFSNMPGAEVLGQIEGAVIIDTPPPGAIQGAGVGVAAIIGEFADMTRAVKADSTGLLTTLPQPTEVFGAQDMVTKFGGFDPSIGDFGVSGGNGYAELKNKKFSRLVVAAVNLASEYGVRLYRDLPTNTSTTDPTPVVPVVAATVAAATAFEAAGTRVKHAARVTFKDTPAFVSGTDGAVTANVDAATAASVISSAGPFDFRGLTTPMLRVAFNAGGDQSFDVAAAAATAAGSGASYPVTADLSITVSNTNGFIQLVSVSAAANATAMAAQLNTALVGCRAVVNGTNVDIVSDHKGSGATVQINVVTNSVGTSGFSVGTSTGTGDVADLGAVTATELVTLIDGPLTNGSATAVSGALKFTSSTLGSSSTAQFKSASTASSRMGGDFATNVQHTGTAAGPGAAAYLTFTSSGSNFNDPDALVHVGDVLVLGVIGAGGANGSNAGIYRVRSVASATSLVLEKLNGASFNWTTGTGLVFRIHPGDVADTGGRNTIDGTAGFVLPARPLDASVAADTVVPPLYPADAATATSCAPLSGLYMHTHPTEGLSYDANVQAENAEAHASIDALYVAAIESLNVDAAPASEVNLVHAARTSATIRSTLKSTVLDWVGQGVGRCAILWPELDVTDLTTVLGDASPGVGALRDERVFYAWPHAQVYVSEAANVSITGADGLPHDDGLLDLSAAGVLLSGLSQLAPERNPGQASEPMKSTLAQVRDFARGTPALSMASYIQMRAKGIVGLRKDKMVGFNFQSGITTSLTSGQKNIARRRFADFIQDSVGARLVQWAKEPMSSSFKTGTHQEVVNFLEELRSENNPAAQRIDDYSVDIKSGNTRELEAKGIWVITGQVQMTPTADVIVFQTEIGEGVVVTRAS